MTACLDDETLAAWAAGALTTTDATGALDHATTCARCGAIIAATVTDGDGAGATVGPYQLRGPLGSGAMGVVFDAWDPVLARPAAVKMIRAVTATAAERARLIDEGRALARLAHPNVVAVYACDVVGDEVYVAMAKVAGRSFERWLDADAPSVAARHAALADVACGLAAIHQAGLVHRDVKPANVVVEPGGRAVVVDLGLARALERPALGGGSGVAGTPHYWAPEIAAGGAATAASDQYAWWRLVARAIPTLPGARGRDLARALARGLADEPAARWPSMAAAAAALASAVMPAGRSRRATAAVMLGALGAVAGGGAAVVALARPGAAPGAACPAITGPARGAPQLARVVAAVVAGGGDPRPIVDEVARRVAVAEGLATRACRDAGSATPAVAVRGRQQRACVEATWRETADAVDGILAAPAAEVALAIEQLAVAPPLAACAAGAVPAVPAPPPPERAERVAAVTAALRAIRVDAAAPPATRWAALEAVGPRVAATGYPPLVATWHHDRADLLRQLGRLDACDDELRLTASAAAAANDDDLRARALINRVRLALQLGRADTAGLIEDATAAVARLANPAFTAELDVGVARAAVVRGEVATAITRLRHALAVYDGLAIPAPRRTVAVLQDLAASLQLDGDLEAAQAMFDRGYQLARAALGDDDHATVEARGARATNLLARGAPAAGVELDAVAAALRRLDGAASAELMAVEGYRCELALGGDDPAAAAPPCAAALAIGEAVFGDASPQLVWPLVLRGRDHLRRGAGAAAAASLERALTIAATGATEPSLPALAEGYLALAYRATGDRRAAGQAGRARAALTPLAADAQVADLLAALAR